MPHYCYSCEECKANKAEWHAKIPKAVPAAVKCLCGGTMRRDYMSEKPNPSTFDPYWSTNLGHEPVFVKSRSHEARLCRERHLERVS